MNIENNPVWNPWPSAYLPWSLHMDGDDVKAVRTQLTGPTASLADPLEQALLVSVADRAVTAAGVQKVPLHANMSKVRRTKAQRCRQ